MNLPEPAAPARAHRLFFALWPDPATRAALVAATREAVRLGGGRPVAADHLHATVAFLGSVPADRMAAVRAAGTAEEGACFDLQLDGIDFWPKPQVLVATGATPPAAAALAERLWQRVEPLGIVRDPRPLRLHVTLARKVRTPAPGLTMPPVAWVAPELALVESVTDPAGARYTVLARWPLAGTAGGGVTP